MKYSVLSQINYTVHIHVCKTFPKFVSFANSIITKYLGLLNIKIQSTHLNYVPAGLLLLPQEVPLGLNDDGTRQHQNKHICQKDKKNKRQNLPPYSLSSP